MHIHILGICGTFMGGVAALARAAGHKVTGCDRNVYPPMSTQLRKLDIEIHEGVDAAQLDVDPDCVVVGNVIRAVYEEAEALVAGEIPYCSFPHVLGELFLAQARSLVIAGTHGETTTTSITAWLADACGLEPGYLMALLAGSAEFFGGIALLLGLLTRPAAAVLAVTMVVAIVSAHIGNGLFMANNGYEFGLVLLAISAGYNQTL